MLSLLTVMDQRRYLALQIRQLEFGTPILPVGGCIQIAKRIQNMEQSLCVAMNTVLVILRQILYDHCSSCGQLIYTLKSGRSPVLSLSWCDDMNIGVGYKDGSVHVINTVSAETLKIFQGQGGGITTLTYVELASG